MYKAAKHGDWMKAIKQQAVDHKPDKLMVGAVALSLVFWRRKPSGAGKDWRKAKSPERAAKASYPVSKPDLTSLERPVEDALTGLFWRDDSQIIIKHVLKGYARHDEPERIGVGVEEIGPGNFFCSDDLSQLTNSVLREIPIEVTDGNDHSRQCA